MKSFHKILLATLLASGLAAPAFAQSSDSENATSTVKIIQPINLIFGANLAFGTVVRPSGAGTSNTVTISTTSDTPAISGGGNGALLSTGTRSRAYFTATGEGGQSVAITVPASVVMSAGGGNNITVTLTGESATDTLTNSIGTTGGFSGDGNFYIGGAFTVSDSTVSGNYTGTFSTTLAYN